MPTTSSHEQAESVIRRVLEAMIDEPRKLQVEAITVPRRVNWRVTADINDTGKLVGKMGVHLTAIWALLSVMGERVGEVWAFRVADPEEGERVRKEPVAANPEHNPGADHALLLDVLKLLLAAPCSIQIESPAACHFRFTVRLGSVQDHERMHTPVPVRNDLVPPFEALQVVFRAIGKQRSVTYQIQFPAK